MPLSHKIKINPFVLLKWVAAVCFCFHCFPFVFTFYTEDYLTIYVQVPTYMLYAVTVCKLTRPHANSYQGRK
jgi:hypothetical protein